MKARVPAAEVSPDLWYCPSAVRLEHGGAGFDRPPHGEKRLRAFLRAGGLVPAAQPALPARLPALGESGQREECGDPRDGGASHIKPYALDLSEMEEKSIDLHRMFEKAAENTPAL